MKRLVPVLLAALALTACSSHRQAFAPRTATCGVDPRAVPTVAAVVSEATVEAVENAEQGARAGHKVGVVAGFIAAIFGGGESESIEESIDRYRRTRDAITVAGALIGAASGAMEGADRGPELDTPFAELLEIEGIEATRPAPGVIEIRIANPTPELLARIAAVVKTGTIDIESGGDTALEIRDALIRLGLPPSSLNARRVDGLDGAAVLRLRLDV
jgi:hypothetical protein